MANKDLQWTFPVGRRQINVRLQPWSLLRTTGFPVRALDGLAAPNSIRAADNVLAAEQALLDLRRHFLEGLWPALRAAVRIVEPRQRSFRALLRCRRLVEERALLDRRCAEILATTRKPDFFAQWNALVETYEEVLDTANLELSGALERAYSRTAEAAGEDRFRHAVFVSNPGFFRAVLDRGSLWPGGNPPRGVRRKLDTLHRYLRRFATKCETVSFFGPVLFTALRPDQQEPVLIGEPRPGKVVVEASVSLVEQLRQRATAATDPADRRAWRSPLFRELSSSEGLEHAVDGRRFRVAPQAMAVWRAADGNRLGELAAAAKGLGPALTVSAWRLPATELHALTRLAAEYQDETVVELAMHRNKYADADWPERAGHLAAAEELTLRVLGATDRDAGKHYADRELFHEDRSSPYSERVTFGAPVLDRFREVAAAVLPLSYLASLLARQDARDVLRTELNGRAGSLAALATRELTARPNRRAQLDAVLRQLITEAGPVLTRQQLDKALAPLWESVEVTPQDACLPSPDVMAVGEDLASATWVLSEMHDDCSSIFGGLERPLHSDRDGLWSEFTGRVGDVMAAEDSATIVSRRRSAHVTPELPGASIELSGMSAKPREDVVPIADVVVPATGDAVEVAGCRRWLYPGDLSSTLHRAVSRPAVVPVPIDLGAHTPRIVIDGVVYQRARWRIKLPPKQADPVGRWLDIQRIRWRLALPRHVFVKHPGEPKPLYVDFADPLSVLDIARLDPASVVVSEMLPTPDQLWWRVGGEPQCAEFRLGWIVSPVTVASE
jgi:hypothetical protein